MNRAIIIYLYILYKEYTCFSPRGTTQIQQQGLNPLQHRANCGNWTWVLRILLFLQTN